MRQAADILSSAPAMQIRYLEAMQAMAKSANSKVIFLPAANQTMPGSPAFNAASAAAAQGGAGGSSSSNNNNNSSSSNGNNPFDEGMAAPIGNLAEFSGGGLDPGFQQALNARIVENI